MTTALKPVYQWAEGSRISKQVDAQVVGEHLQQLVGAGGISPSRVVEEARNPLSPLHLAFEWDNEVASEEWRKQQARSLLKSIRVVTLDAPPQIAYISVLVGDQRSYVPQQTVMESPAYREYALQDALRYLKGFEARYHQIAALQPVLDAIRQVKEAID